MSSRLEVGLKGTPSPSARLRFFAVSEIQSVHQYNEARGPLIYGLFGNIAFFKLPTSLFVTGLHSSPVRGQL